MVTLYLSYRNTVSLQNLIEDFVLVCSHSTEVLDVNKTFFLNSRKSFLAHENCFKFLLQNRPTYNAGKCT